MKILTNDKALLGVVLVFLTIGFALGMMLTFILLISNIGNSQTNNGLMKVEDCILVKTLLPCACCGDYCKVADCDWDKRYQVDDINCKDNHMVNILNVSYKSQ